MMEGMYFKSFKNWLHYYKISAYTNGSCRRPAMREKNCLKHKNTNCLEDNICIFIWYVYLSGMTNPKYLVQHFVGYLQTHVAFQSVNRQTFQISNAASCNRTKENSVHDKPQNMKSSLNPNLQLVKNWCLYRTKLNHVLIFYLKPNLHWPSLINTSKS